MMIVVVNELLLCDDVNYVCDVGDVKMNDIDVVGEYDLLVVMYGVVWVNEGVIVVMARARRESESRATTKKRRRG